MSRRNKYNRENEKSDYHDSKETGISVKPALPVIEEEYDEDEDEYGVSVFSTIGTAFAGCWGKIASCSRSTCSSTWAGLCKIPSFCVLRWDSEQDEADGGEQDGRRELAAALPGKATTVLTDEDELPTARWLSLGIKTIAATAIAAVLAGGYVAVTPLLFDRQSEVADVAAAEDELVDEGGISLVSDSQSAEPLPVVSQSAAPPIMIPPDPEPAPVPDKTVAVTPTPLPPPQTPAQDSFPIVPFGVPDVSSVVPGIDPFAAIPPITESVAPTLQTPSIPLAHAPSAESIPAESIPAFTALRPLAALEPTQLAPTQLASVQPALQPLAALPISAFPEAVLSESTLPQPAFATADAPFASNRNVQPNNAAFTSPPTAPDVKSISQTPVQPTIALVEPIREVVPAIPSIGTIQAVPPPVPKTMPVVAETPVQTIHPNESAPSIPQDAPLSTETPLIAAATPTPTQALAADTAPRIVPLDSQPMDWQLWEQIREIQSTDEPLSAPKTTPSTLHFGSVPATSEPVLRFTPREGVVTPQIHHASEEDTLLRDVLDSFQSENNTMQNTVQNTLEDDAANSMEQFSALMPTQGATTGTAPSSDDLARFLPILEQGAVQDVPQPVVAMPSPPYREESSAAGGTTFQSRIDSEISRSPSETEKYVIQQGDTYMTISDRFYGTSLLYSALAQHNQKLGVGWRPAQGVVIEVPPAEYLRTQYGTADNQRKNRLSALPQGLRYIVQEGDTVFRLATDVLHDSARWREIYAMNADRIQNVRELQPGMEILLPMTVAEKPRSNVR